MSGFDLPGNRIQTDSKLHLLFQMDANSDGTLEWNEYISYLLLEYQERQTMLAYDQDTPFPYPMEVLERSHVDSVCRIAMLQVSRQLK